MQNRLFTKEICFSVFLLANGIMDKNLPEEQILCLQLLGYMPAEILKATSTFFNNVMSRDERAEELLEKAVLLLRKQERLGVFVLPFYHPDFPGSLRRIGNDCPPLIHLLGNKALLNQEAVTVIGARQADKRGCEAAYKWGAEYAKRGKAVISGLALGCDAAAHRGCLDVRGNTIAIVATGLDLTHPKENKSLQEQILRNGGLLLSEQIMGVKANPTRLVARNRLQAVLSQDVIVAQCPLQSGTMHTVRFAQRYKKRIYAVRFSRYDAKSSGNEYLIEEGIALPL